MHDDDDNDDDEGDDGGRNWFSKRNGNNDYDDRSFVFRVRTSRRCNVPTTDTKTYAIDSKDEFGSVFLC